MKNKKLIIVIFCIFILVIVGLISYIVILQKNSLNKNIETNNIKPDIEKNEEKSTMTIKPWYETLETPKSWQDTFVTVP